EEAHRERRAAERQADRARAELERLRQAAEREREEVEQAGRRAAVQIQAVAEELPTVEFPAPPAAAAGGAAAGQDGNLGDGLEKAWGDVKGEVGGLATGAFNHANVFNMDKFKENWSNDYRTAREVADDPVGAAKAMAGGTVEPLAESYESSGVDEAAGRLPGVLAGVLGGKGINKLDELGDGRGRDGGDGDGGDGGDGGEGNAPEEGQPPGGAAAEPTPNQLEKYRAQLESDGPRSLEKSRRSLSERLEEHVEKLQRIREEGGYTSSVEREIRNYRNEIEAIDRISKQAE
nr:hypothetical protein [Actinomycetota bacterium]